MSMVRNVLILGIGRQDGIHRVAAWLVSCRVIRKPSPRVPDRRKHRGPHPDDTTLFASACVPALRSAVHDLSWLLSRGYAERSSIQIVGNRHRLRQRQRVAVMRCACSDAARDGRKARELGTDAVAGCVMLLDGYNVLCTVEAALAGGVLLRARDGCLRDMASMHGHWRKVEETAPAVELVARTLRNLAVPRATWYLDAPVSNSGRLARLIEEAGLALGMDWTTELVQDPDPVLAASDGIVATADSVVLDTGGAWFNLAGLAVGNLLGTPWIVDLSGEPDGP